MKLLNFFAIFYLLISSKILLAADAFDLPQIVAVENKTFNPHYDVTANASYLPLDAFYKATSLGVSYTHSFASFISWEIVNAQTATSHDTNLKKDLLTNFQVKPIGILDTVDQFLTSNLIYTPIYSKNLLFNKSIVHGEFSFVFGGGTLKYRSGEAASLAGGGVILRFFKSKLISYKFDSRIYQQSAKNKSSDLIMIITLGLSFELGDHHRYNTEEISRD